ncbi:MAG: hypothetical protein ACK4VM_19465, partial [Bosea sp. (in: a-proteobacteria)]
DNRTELQRTRTEKARLTEEIAAVHVQDALLEASPAIMAAHSGITAYTNARNDLARVRAEVEDFDQRLAQAARRLGLVQTAELETGQPPDAELARLRALVEEGSSLDRSLREVRERMEEQHEAMRRLQEQGAARRAMDPKPWADQLAALQPELADLQRMETLQVRVARAQADLSAAAGRLDPPFDDLRVLLSVPLPEAGELSNHRRMIEEARAVATAAGARRKALEEDAVAVTHQLAALEGPGPIVSRDDLSAARAERDARLHELGTKPNPAGFETLAAAIAHADHLADSVLSDAERVTRHAQLSLRRAELDQSLKAAQAQAREADIALSDAVTAFEDAFQVTGLRPSTPERMIEWRRMVDELFRQMRDLDQLRDELEVLTMREANVRPALLGLAEAIGFAAPALPTVAIARGLERRLSEIAQEWTDSRATETKRVVAEEAITRLEERERALLADVGRWQSAFSAAVIKVGLPEDAAPAMALAALDAWRTVPDLLDQRQNRERRVRGMTRDMETFEAGSREVVTQVAPDLAGVPADVAAGLLHERLLAATAENKHRTAISAELERIGLSLARLEAEQQSLTKRAKEFADQLSSTPEALPQVLDDLRQRHRLEHDLRQCRARFAEHADGASEDEIRASLSGFDRISATLEIDRLSAEEDRLVDKMKALGIGQAENERRRRELETGIGAERAAFQRLAAEAEAKELARRWVVLKLAASIL